MSVAAPPRPPAPTEDDHLDPLDALIEEARRRARRRRALSAVAALLLVAAGGAYAGLNRDGGDAAAPAAPAAADRPQQLSNALDRSALAAGRMTLIGIPTVGAGQGLPGWYDVSMLDGVGRLEPFIRCPGELEWCGEAESVDWSPDGKRLAFSVTSYGAANPYNGLHVLDVETGTDRQLPDECAFGWRFDLAWSPDGSTIAYVCSRWGGPAGRIVLVRPEEYSARVLQTGTARHDSSPTWSPSGDRIAFATRVGGRRWISVIGSDGSGRRTLAEDGTAPDWSPDGSKIAYATGCGGIKLITPLGRDVTPARGAPACLAVGVAGKPTWSPDGAHLAVNNRGGVYLMRKDGSGLRRYTSHDGIGIPQHGRPAWRPG